MFVATVPACGFEHAVRTDLIKSLENNLLRKFGVEVHDGSGDVLNSFTKRMIDVLERHDWSPVKGLPLGSRLFDFVADAQRHAGGGS